MGGCAAPFMVSAQLRAIRCGLRAGRSPRRGIVEEQLLVNRYDKRLNVPCCKKKTYQRRDSSCRYGAQMRRLAKLARGLILSVRVGMSQGLGCEQHEQGRQGKGQHPNRVTPRVVPASHFDFEANPSLFFDAGSRSTVSSRVLRNPPTSAFIYCTSR